MNFKKKAFLFVVTSGTIFIIFQLYLIGEFNNGHFQGDDLPVILWWTPFVNELGMVLDCEDVKCFSTQNRSFRFRPNTKAILFYGSDFKVHDLPLPRLKSEIWGLMHEESLRNNLMFAHEAALNLFNYSATFSRYSDVPLTLADLPSLEAISSTKHFVTLEEKNAMIVNSDLAPVLYVQSDCDTASERDVFVAELMKFIRVDSYGSCLNNRQLPKSLKDNYVSKLNHEEFLAFTARYKFTLAFENAICEDYITEKLWRPIIVGSIPVYYGSPSFEDWLPNANSAVSVADFPGPEQLAGFINELHHNDTEYVKYLSHKLSDSRNRIKNKRLLDALDKRKTDSTYGFDKYVEEFQCHVCRRIQGSDEEKASVVTRKAYNCPVPKYPLLDQSNERNSWSLQWNIEKCAAKLLALHLASNTSILKDEFEEKKFEMYSRNDC